MRYFGRKITSVLLSLGVAIFALAAWIEIGLLDDSVAAVTVTDDSSPDYYIDNFTSTGVDNNGSKYHLSATRLVHYAGEAHYLTRPRIVQYSDGIAREITAADGRWDDAGEVVRLSGEVRVVEGDTVVTSRRMLVRLKGG